MPKLAALSIVCLLYSLFAVAQDSIPKDSSRDFTIRHTDNSKNSFFMNGTLISYDSCQQRLRLFPESALELKKALRCGKKVEAGLSIDGIVGLPALIAGAAAKGEGSRGGWGATTFYYLGSVFAVSLTYALIYNHQYDRHLAKAIQLYNKAITNKPVDHPSNLL